MKQFKQLWLLAGLLGLSGALIAGSLVAHAAGKERIVKIVAQRFSFSPNEIKLRKGEDVILEFTSLDFVHGFSIPDLNLRADLPPGKVIQLHITPEKTGVYDFLCDNFCGSGHEEMHGRITVTN